MIDTMMELITSIFGTYTPVTYTDYLYMSGAYQEVEMIAGGVAGVDWPWLVGVLLFCICLYSFFRIIGSFIRR